MKQTIVNFLVRTAENSPDYLHFWAAMMNHAKGNVTGIMQGFEMAGVSTTDISKAYHELKLKAHVN